MLKRSKSKRKSMDSAELSRGLRKERQTGNKWYQEDLKNIEKIEKDKGKKNFFGKILTRMRSGSRLHSDSTSQLPRMEALIPENSTIRRIEPIPERETTPENEIPEQLQLSIKRNIHLKSFICDQPIPESPEYEKENEDEDMFVLSGRKVTRKENNETTNSPEPTFHHRHSMRAPLFPAERSDMPDPSTSEYPTTPKRIPFDSSNSCVTPTRGEFRTPGGTLQKSAFSSSTLQRVGGFLKRGLSSVGPKSFVGQTASPVVKLSRKDSITSAKSTGGKRRRFSDVNCYNHFQQMQFSTPTTSIASGMNYEEEVSKIERFEEVVQVSSLTAQEELEAFIQGRSSLELDAIIADSLTDGKPISEFSAWLFQYFQISSQVTEIMQSSYHKLLYKAAKLKVSTGNGSNEILITIGVVRNRGSNLACITRTGYDSAIGLALSEGKTRLLVAPAFFPCDTPYNNELAVAMLKTIFVIVSSQDKLNSITICGRNSAERLLLIEELSKLVVEKREALGSNI